MPADSARSRSGCVTCRKRRKKCPEDFEDTTHPGVCGRCYSGSYTCERAEPPRRKTKPKPMPPTVSGSSSAQSGTPPFPASTVGAAAFNIPSTDFFNPHPPTLPIPQPYVPVASTSYAPHSYIHPDTEELSNFFEALDSLPSYPPASLEDISPGGLSDYELAARTGAGTEMPGVLASSSSARRDLETPASSSVVDEVQVDATDPSLYNTFNDGFMRSLPKPVRKLITARFDKVASSNDLNRSASLALVLLYRVRSQEGGPEAQAKLMEQVSPTCDNHQSEHYFQQALGKLQTPIPLEAQLVAVLDLQFHQHDQSGAAAAYAILLLGEFFVAEALGKRPKLDFHADSALSSVALRCFAYTDVLATVCLKHRRTVFDICDLPGDENGSTTQSRSTYDEDAVQTGDFRLDSHLGLPVGLLLCLAATSNLSVDMATMDPEVVKAKAAKIEREIRSWRPAPPAGGTLETSNSLAYLEDLRTSEMWRHAALIHLFQSVHQLGPLAPVLRHSLAQMLSLGQRNENDPRLMGDSEDSLWAGSVRACPWFMAATVAIAVSDREQCKKGLSECGPQKGYSDNLEAAELIWNEVDKGGWTLPWKDLLEKNGKYVAFL
ncbi:hypothetical protein T439DRAFT_360706 [Meredithblackwellia eburnea MCA 4105]